MASIIAYVDASSIEKTHIGECPTCAKKHKNLSKLSLQLLEKMIEARLLRDRSERLNNTIVQIEKFPHHELEHSYDLIKKHSIVYKAAKDALTSVKEFAEKTKNDIPLDAFKDCMSIAEHAIPDRQFHITRPMDVPPKVKSLINKKICKN